MAAGGGAVKHVKANKDSAIGFNDFMFTFSTEGKDPKKESYVNFRS